MKYIPSSLPSIKILVVSMPVQIGIKLFPARSFAPLPFFCESSFVLALLPFSSPLLFLRRSVVRPPPPRSKISRDARNQDLEGRTEVKVELGRDGNGLANGMGCMGWVTA